ncbi:MAG: hypothetical protein AAF892_15015 [Cyanobacteria bacterium P01_D01_bin.71]
MPPSPAPSPHHSQAVRAGFANMPPTYSQADRPGFLGITRSHSTSAIGVGRALGAFAQNAAALDAGDLI